MPRGRDATIWKAHRDGVSEVQLAGEYGVSRQRIHQIVTTTGRVAFSRKIERDAYVLRAAVVLAELDVQFARRRTLNRRLRRLLDELRTIGEELQAMDVDAILDV